MTNPKESAILIMLFEPLEKIYRKEGTAMTGFYNIYQRIYISIKIKYKTVDGNCCALIQ